jgi:hypothetical protein
VAEQTDLEGGIPARKIGRHWRMTEQDIEDALEAFRSDPHPCRPTGR